MFIMRKYVKGIGMTDVTVSGLTVHAEPFEQQMSDYWIYGIRYHYLDHETGTFKTWTIEGRTKLNDNDIDAPDYIIAAWRKFVYENAVNRNYLRDMDTAKNWARRFEGRTRPQIGDWVVVNRGRKVPKGTQGILFWMKDYTYGYRAGIYVAGKADPVFIALDNIDAAPVAPETLRRQVVAEHKPRSSK